ncbi:hypothetical protein CLV35_0718 [Motilibacter peucedani]|uniref:Phosphoglyceromutase n=1 Tax=Motilibacter peucedani TaxID=598650 RepID=A0A420XTV0_9ACTN|nr:hypothetical protein [Motilibacter peucedani]RKS80292.1 hypothetical protein CLV35_0718 [Motilibacter peucedani]
MHRAVVRVLLACALAAVALCTGLTAPAQAAPGDRPLVVLGVGGLRWDQLSSSSTPGLWSLLDGAALGSLVTRTARPVTCPSDGWLTIGAGRRAQAVAHSGPAGSRERCPAQGPGVRAGSGTASVAGWAGILARADRSDFDAQPGLLGETLAAADRCALAVGPGAALALATRDGSVVRYLGSAAELDGPALTTCPVTVVDLGTTDDLGAADAAAERLAQLARSAGADTLLLGVSGDGRSSTPHLGVAAYAEAGASGRWLTSRSTRRPTLSQLTDLAPTLLDRLAVPLPDTLIGARLTPGDVRPAAQQAVERLVRDDSDEQTARRTQAWFWTALLVLQVLLYLAVGVALGRSWAGPAVRQRAVGLARLASLVFGAVPVATFLADLVPWERSGAPTLVLIAVVLAFAGLTAALAVAGPWRRRPLGPPTVVGAVTGLVIGVDVVLGGSLQEGSLMGYFPTVAGRFFGLGNQAFSLFATGALLGAAGAAAALLAAGRSRVLAAAAVGVVGLATLVVDGSPGLGADVGGVLAIVPGFAVLCLLVAGRRLSVGRLAAAGAAAVAALAALAALDAARPAESRTHLGRFARDVAGGRAVDVLQRKADANLGLLVSSPLTLLLPAAFAFIVLVLRRPARWHAPALASAYDREPLLRPLLVAFLVLQVLGFALNDSGVAIPAVALMVVVPLLIAASAQALRLDAAAAPG